MKKVFLLLITVLFTTCQHHNTIPLSLNLKNLEVQKHQSMQMLLIISKNFPVHIQNFLVFEMGETDAGYPLHLVVYDSDGKTQLNTLKNSTKNSVLINNGIHPGESDGIDASMLLLRDIVQNDSLKKRYQNTLIAVIPIYNIGGSLNRNSHTRANQNGPIEYGFRGNTRNFRFK